MLPFLAPPALAAPPASVVIWGSLQTEAGCASDFQASCANTQMAYNASDEVWRLTLTLPAGAYTYKAVLNGDPADNYGQSGQANGPAISLQLAQPATVRFYYDPQTRWVTDSVNSVIAVAAGSFQSELGCPGDWQPNCLRSWLQDADGDGVYEFTTTALPLGSYETKVVVDESWSVNYGVGGDPSGSNLSFVVPAPGTTVRFRFDAQTRVPTVAVVYPITATVQPLNGGSVTCSPNPVEQGGQATCTASPAAGYRLDRWSGDCTGSSCVLSNVASAAEVTAHFVRSRMTLASATGTGTVEIQVSGTGCELASAQAVLPPAGAPNGVNFPHGLVDFTVTGCVGSATVTLTYPSAFPAGQVRLWKTSASGYATFPATVGATTLQYVLQDNQTGDDDPAVGTIRDPAGVGILPGASDTTPVPALPPAGLALLSSLLLWGAWRHRRR